MASEEAGNAGPETISRHNLECSICQERYQQPKILECLHSFCEQCLLKYCSTKHQGSTEIPCPVCQQETQLPETGVQGLKNNFYLIGLVEQSELQDKVASLGNMKLLCETCDDGNEATHRCLDCAQNVCTHCRGTQLRTAATSNHMIVSMEDIREGKVTVTKNLPTHPECPNHEGESTRFFCTTCEMLICRDCTVIDHCKPKHTYIDRNKATLMYKQSLSELFDLLEGTVKELKESQENVSRMEHQLGVTVEGTVIEVQDRAAEIRAEVTAQENCLVKDIQTIQKDRKQQLDKCKKIIHSESEKIKYALETAREVTTASDSDFLSLYPTINTDLKLLAGQSIPRVDNRLTFLKFKQSEGVSVGEVLTEGKLELCREFGKMGNGPGEFNVAWGVAVRQQPDEIAVTDINNKRVVICSIDGKQKSAIQMEEYPFGIAATHSKNRLVVVEFKSSFVKVFNSDNSLAFQFPTVQPDDVGKITVDLRGVAVKKDGTIVVGDVERMVLTEHRSTDGDILLTTPVKIEPWFLAVDSSDRVVVSGCSHAVVVTDGNSTTELAIKPTINDQPVQESTGVYTDSSGIYVAMHNGDNAGHIHHYDPQGGFLKCIAQGLHYPQGITFTADWQLAVADYYTVKMYHQV
ncbi:E3 ubiquitin-protein ligase TRIM56-like [Patiria miniata]|uniref:Uncharacterized protein n=1 Tax=Patiria miniata TaxID=46514 RepID=A0A914AFZ9_PATMI|nr:E3 ubiquitin-protein ligase TRIM56-like [Patiria miniata]